MILEHFLYNISIAILVGIFYKKHFNRNPSWIIVVCAGLPDLDYILQSICYYIYDNTGYILPIMINHGNFHSLVIITLLSLIFGYVIYRLFKENIYDAIICTFIGGFIHLLCDMSVYSYIYYPFYPISEFMIKTTAILKETLNMPFGLGDWNIFIVGLCLVIYACIVKFAIEGMDSLDYFRFHARNAYTICMAFIGDTTIQP